MKAISQLLYEYSASFADYLFFKIYIVEMGLVLLFFMFLVQVPRAHISDLIVNLYVAVLVTNTFLMVVCVALSESREKEDWREFFVRMLKENSAALHKC